MHLLVIDPQNDFCDLPPDWWGTDPLSPGHRVAPALPVPGAHADMMRLADFIRRMGPRIEGITLTLDSHARYGIERPAFWRDGTGAAPAPFTEITAAQVRAGRWRPRDDALRERALEYLRALEAAGRYRLMVWPPHAEIGSWGHAVHAAVMRACGEWQERSAKPVRCVVKGTSPWTEHYSALQAEVPDAADPDTGWNDALLARLREAGTLFVAGEAGSHCVRATVEHLVDALDDRARARIALLTDCMSPVTGFEAAQRDFLATMRGRGLKLAVSTESVA